MCALADPRQVLVEEKSKFNKQFVVAGKIFIDYNKWIWKVEMVDFYVLGNFSKRLYWLR